MLISFGRADGAIAIVCRASFTGAIDPQLRVLLTPEHPDFFFLSLKCACTRGPVTVEFDPMELYELCLQCVGQLIRVPACTGV